ncbi:hypothetical protein GCM10010448_70470 [Streptomyces glomeratus]|uniref:Uncharacterized protein n=1 Tax=Streptomyces glomeratus TaxID=284452 RepID=A0ABP6MA94_9ACTN
MRYPARAHTCRSQRPGRKRVHHRRPASCTAQITLRVTIEQARKDGGGQKAKRQRIARAVRREGASGALATNGDASS